MNNKNFVASDELLDADLKQILGKRYEDMSDKFTPEAQQKRRNNRLMFTVRVSLFVLTICNSMVWAMREGLVGVGFLLLTWCVGMIVIGYNIGVCVSHNKGWRE